MPEKHSVVLNISFIVADITEAELERLKKLIEKKLRECQEAAPNSKECAIRITDQRLDEGAILDDSFFPEKK